MDRDVWTTSLCSTNGCVQVMWASGCTSGTCVEVAWTKVCNSAANCVEVGHQEDRVLVRDSKDPDGPVLEFTRPMWGWVLDRIRFDLRITTVSVAATSVHWRASTKPGAVVLEFTRAEWDEFVRGVREGTFDLEVAA